MRAKIHKVAVRLNKLSKDFDISKLQYIRKNIKNMKSAPLTYEIFSNKSIIDHYAFHSGGRNEIQINIGYEESKNRFRYGIAFSIESGRTLPMPVKTMRPKIKKFNEYINLHKHDFSSLKMWHYSNSSSSKDYSPKNIPSNLVKDGTFIFLGKHLKKTPDKLTLKDYKEILVTLDKLLPLYQYVESDGTIENSIARICWNDNYWTKPSGKSGKSLHPDSFEKDYKFGHEEWLLDTSKIVNGYHYGFLQQFNNNFNAYIGNTHNITLYSIDSSKPSNKIRYWVGKIKNVEVVSQKESNVIHKAYKKNGWLKSMEKQVREVKANVNEFNRLKPDKFFNMKFKLEDLELYDEPIAFSTHNPRLSSDYYSSLLPEKSAKIPSTKRPKFKFKAGTNNKKTTANMQYSAKRKKVNLVHNDIQNNCIKQLEKIYGKNHVGSEKYGIDIMVRDKKKIVFYEVKTAQPIIKSIRQALSQLMEYSYYPNEINASKLIIVSQNPIDNDAILYLKKLRKDFKLPVHYQQYDIENKVLLSKVY